MPNNLFGNKNDGFSFVELLIIIAVLAIISVLTASAFSSFYKTQALNGAAEQAVSLINKARSDTLSSKSASQYGVHFEASRLVFFKGAVFTEPDPDNEELIFPPLIEAFNISLNGGGDDLIFERLTGKTNQYGAISFRIKSDVSKTKTVTVELNGAVSVN